MDRVVCQRSFDMLSKQSSFPSTRRDHRPTALVLTGIVEVASRQEKDQRIVEDTRKSRYKPGEVVLRLLYPFHQDPFLHFACQNSIYCAILGSGPTSST